MNRLTGSSALAVEVQVLRAGAAASAERIKELEARVAELEAALRNALPHLEGCFWHHAWYSEPPPEPDYLVNIRALLKESSR